MQEEPDRNLWFPADFVPFITLRALETTEWNSRKLLFQFLHAQFQFAHAGGQEFEQICAPGMTTSLTRFPHNPSRYAWISLKLNLRILQRECFRKAAISCAPENERNVRRAAQNG